MNAILFPLPCYDYEGQTIENTRVLIFPPCGILARPNFFFLPKIPLVRIT